MHTNIEKQILQETKGLPENALDEVLQFIQFIKSKWQKEKLSGFSDNVAFELDKLGNDEWLHLENEVKDYKKVFPHAVDTMAADL
jgi:hypothetical protein